MAWLVVVATVALVALQIWQDRTTYPQFKAMTETADRQAMYRRWTFEAFFRFGVFGVLALALLSRLDAVLALPADIALARDALAARIGIGGEELSGIGLGGALALMAGALIGGLIPLVIKPKPNASPAAGMIGDIAPLIPRNWAEARWGAALSINAGVTEEIVFRLALPFALYAITGDFLVALLAAALLFGLIHAYQGVVGVIATTIVGLLMTLIWLASGQIWLAIALHALMDLRAMVLQPWAAGALNRP